MPIDVLEVTGGQDRGARFGLLGDRATIGRGPVMDMVLTDPRVSRRHARLWIEGARLLVEDCGSTSGTLVNGVAVAEPTALAPGDRLALGATELRVLWSPGAPRPPPPSRPPPPPPAAVVAPATAPAPAGEAAGERPTEGGQAAPELPLQALPRAACALAGLALVGVWLPALANEERSASIWGLGSLALRAQGIAGALVAGALAAAWLVAASRRSDPLLRALLALGTAAAGGLVAGLPLFLALAELGGSEVELAVPLLLSAGVLLVGCGLAGSLALMGPPRGPAGALPREGAALAAAGALVGGALAVAGGPLPWVANGALELGGFDEAIAAGRWIVPLGVAVTLAGLLVPGAARVNDRRAAVPAAAVAAALAAALLAYAASAAAAYGSGSLGPGTRLGSGLSLGLSGAAIALLGTLLGGLALLAERGRGLPSPSPAEGARAPREPVG